MRKINLLIAGLIAASSMSSQAAHAQAGYVTVTYQGRITHVDDGSSYTIGEPIFDSVTFDPSKLKDFTATGNAVLAGPHIKSSLSFASIFTASLSDDPLASMSIRIGNDVFTKFDQDNYGTTTGDAPFSLGVGDFPNVFYLNSAFAGIGGTFINARGAYLATDPIASALGYFDGHSFYIGDDTSDAEGEFDFVHAVSISAAVPEPGAWAMMIAGFGAAGAAMRRRKLYTAGGSSATSVI